MKRTLRAAAAAALLMLAACESKPPESSPMPTGESVRPPIGWIVYCHRHPEDPGCPS